MSAAEELEPSPLTRAWIARQAIIDRAGATYGYELLFRSSPANRAEVPDGVQATAQAVLTAFTEVGLDTLCGGRRKAMFHVDESMLSEGALDALPMRRVLLRLDRCPDPEAPLAATLRELSAAGHRLVLPAHAPRADHLLDAAELVTLDISRLTPDVFAARAGEIKSRGAQLLVRRVETVDERERALAAGADLVCGYHLQMPEMVSGTHIPADRRAVLRLLSKVQSDKTPTAELEEHIRTDASLSYRLIRLLSTTRFSTTHRVESVRHALVMLGRKRLAKWVSLIALSGIDDRPEALLEVSLTRARMCEVLGAELPAHSPATYFTVGLLSAVDAMLGRPMRTILKDIAIAPALRDAIVDRSGPLGRILEAVIDYESGEWRAVDMDVVDPGRLADAYFEAARYSLELIQELNREG